MNTSEKSMFVSIKSAIQRSIDWLLKGTHNYFFSFLPERIGWLTTLFLKLFYSGIKTDRSQVAQLRDLPQNAVVVYATQYKSRFEFFYFYSRYKREKLPYPQVGMDYRIFFLQPISRIFRVFLAHVDHFIRFRRFPDPYGDGFIKEQLLQGRAGILPLLGERGFYRRFVKSKTDPIQFLIELQGEIDRPIIIVPQLMFFTQNPPRAVPSLADILFGPENSPGKLRRVWCLFKKPDKIFVEISKPVNLQYYLAKPENHELTFQLLSLALRRKLQDRMNRHRQSITGPVLKPLNEIKENILSNKRLRTFMEHHAEKRNIPLYKIHKKADSYLDEIASDYNVGVIKLGATLIRWFFGIMFEGVTVNHDMLHRIRQKSQKGPLILIPCHKSHIDYLMLSYLMHINNMPCPQIAAGKNLSFWPLGPFFRGGGAFFIRRTFRGALLYSRVFKEYIYKLLQEGFNIEFFIEGGRSRTGKLLMPKLGLFSIILEAYRNGACNDLIFVPIFIGYDRILEESAYLHEIEGGKKEDENIWQVVKAPRFLKKRYGKIYIKFQEPISLKTYLREMGKPLEEMTSKEQNTFCREMGFRIVNGIDRASVVTPHAVVAGALLNMPKTNFTYEELMEVVEIYMNYLISQNVNLADTLLYENVYAMDHALESYVQRKLVEVKTETPASRTSDAQDEEKSEPGKRYRVIENRRPNLEYYKNNSISHFVPAAFTALAILERDAFQFSAHDLQEPYKFLQEFFQNEFARDVDTPPEQYLRKTIKAFIDDAILMPHPTIPDQYNLTSAGFRKLKIFAAFLKTFFESYWIVLNFFMRFPQKDLSAKDRVKKIQSRGNRMYKRHLTERPEALSKINYINAMEYFLSHGVRNADDTEKIDHYAEIIQRYLNLLSS